MSDYEIVNQRDWCRYRVPSAGLTIGRNADCDIFLDDSLVSRRHARIHFEDNRPVITDLGSRNGIRINQQTVERAVLREGDEIQVGPVLLKLMKHPDSTLGRSVIPLDRADDLHDSIISSADNLRLPVLYRAARLLGSVFDPDELLDQILDLIFEALPVRRGFVITREAEGETAVHASKTLESAEEGPPLSQTLIRHVFEHGEAMLTLDAQDDSRFDGAASIVNHEIRAAMCAPMRGREKGVVGAVYVDSGTQSRAFKTGDLELLTAIAQVVGMAVENARLYRETLEHERLVAIGQATAGVGHCVKNVLTGIRAGSDFITQALEAEDLKLLDRGWPILKRSVDRIEQIVMNMLDYSRDRQPEYTPTDLNMIAIDVVELQRQRAEKHGVQLEIVNSGDCRAEVDSQRIYRALLNLVTNAIDACENSGGSVTVKAVCDETSCCISVADTGCGIPPEVRARIPDAFFSTKGSSGTGLGLACSYKIAAEHGGQIEIESEAGKGTVFRLYLPRKPAPPGSPRMTRITETGKKN
jgi:two-component system, NtrC family, sensor kinase